MLDMADNIISQICAALEYTPSAAQLEELRGILSRYAKIEQTAQAFVHHRATFSELKRALS